MSNLSGWDVGILAIAGYVAIVMLVRLMRHRRDQIVSRLQAQVAYEQECKRNAERREKQKQNREQYMKMYSSGKESDTPAA